jgi:4-amino-4-deoxy-L-arabinose transferase-like glycosyltransferase
MRLRHTTTAAAACVAFLLLDYACSCALTIRGDPLWRGNFECPEQWNIPAIDDSQWKPVASPWVFLWPKDWPADPLARPMWGSSGASVVCVRRHFDLSRQPSGPAIAHVWVDDDYEFYLNGTFVGASKDGAAQLPGETYNVSSLLHTGHNVIALKLIDVGGDRGALFSLSLPGLPDFPLTAAQLLHRTAPWLMFFGVLIFALAIGVAVLTLRRRTVPSLSRLPAGVVAAASILLVAACQWLLQTQNVYTAYPYHGWAQWHWLPLSAISLLFVALVLLSAPEPPVAEPPPRTGTQLVLLIAILALAVWFRTYKLDTIPTGLFQDEAWNGNDALRLIQTFRTDGIQLWSDTVGGRPTLFLYLLGACLHVFGVSYLSLKIVPVTLEVAAVAAVYAIGRLALGPRAGLWAAFLLAVSRWDIHYSRMAWEVNCVPFLSAAGFALLLYGLGRGRGAALSLLAAGVVLSAGLYTYAAYRAIPAAALLFIAVTALSADRSALRARLQTLVTSGMLAFLVALPLLLFAWNQPGRYWERYNDVSLTYYMKYYATPMPWLHQIGKGFLGLNHRGDELVRHNLPGAPQLDAITGALFLLGLAAPAPPGRRRGFRLIWTWFLTFLALASLTRDAPHATRYLGLLVPAVLFGGHGAERLLARLRTPRAMRGVATALVALLVTATATVNAYQYFVVEAADPGADYYMDLTGRVLCEYLRRQDNVHVYWTPDIAFWADGQCEFLARGHYTAQEIKLPALTKDSGLYSLSRPAVVVVGPEFIDQHHDQLGPGQDGLPRVALPLTPLIQRDHEGRPLYYLYRLPNAPATTTTMPPG